MALFDLYLYISETEIKEASSPLYTTKEVPDEEVTIIEETVVNEETGEEEVVTREETTVTNRVIEVITTNPTQADFISAGYKTLTTGRVPEREIVAGEGIKTTYENNETIVVNKDIFTKEVIDEPKPEEPLDDYHYYQAYTYETETQVINSWKITAKEIIDVTELDEQTQYKGEQYNDVIEETQVKRTYEVIDKEVINDPDLPPDDYKEAWYTKEQYTKYEAKEIHIGYTYTPTRRYHIDHLECTKRIFQLCLKEMKGITYTQLTAIIDSNDDFASEYYGCIQLLRGNEALDQVAPTFGLTSEDIDNIFLYANNEINLEQLKG